MSVARVTLRFDVLPGEKERLEKVCKAYGINKIDFLRASISLAEKEIIETSNNLLKGYQHEQPRFYKEEYMKHFKDRQIAIKAKEGEEMEDSAVGYCKCDNSSSVYSGVGDFGYWSVCNDCHKVVEDSLVYYNHYDGEDHCED